MDIEYLLFLQDFRNGINDALTPFMEWISLFGVTYIVLLPAFVYWCLDKRKGLLLFAGLKISHTLNSMVKLTACVYRPWIRDARILPAGDSITTATGYSFPSGHTMMVTPIYGGLALISRKRAARLFWIAAILVTGFSRNYLGVHTPQDVLVGLALGTFSICLAKWLLDYLDAHPEKDGLVMLACAAVGILTLVYVSCKSYPMDYVDGKLLVDPDRMTRDAWGDSGGLAAFMAAWYIERRWIKFSSTGWNFRGVLLCALGLLPLCWIIGGLPGVTADWFGPHKGKLVHQILLFFYVMNLWPLVLKLCAGSKTE
ncbi:MAG: phosphatase PAP2 family protein [Synergistaceae bacterium]|nr:phosphatase PAP2 family protein [Synergistaceae bacterium]